MKVGLIGNGVLKLKRLLDLLFILELSVKRLKLVYVLNKLEDSVSIIDGILEYGEFLKRYFYNMYSFMRMYLGCWYM